MRKAIAALAVTTVSISVLTACGGSHDDSKGYTPASLVGDWHQTNSKSTGIYMEAHISGESIQVNMKDRGSSGIYWMGSFDSSKNPARPFKVVSKADPDALKWSIFGSQDSTKVFEYKDGVLSYEFTMMRTKTTVHMVKDADLSQTPTQTVYVPDGYDDHDSHYRYPSSKKTRTKSPMKVASPPKVKPAAPKAPAPRPAPPRIKTTK